MAASRARPARRGAAAALAALSLAALGLASPALAAPPCPLPALLPALQAPQPGDLYLRQGRVGCTTLEVEVVVHSIAGVFTAGFDLGYPASLLEYQGYSPGFLLEKSRPKTAPLYLVRNPIPGSLVLSMTRFSPDGGVTADGAEVLVTLRFRRLEKGTGAIDFLTGQASPAREGVMDDRGKPVPARFGPGHGGTATLP